MSTRPTVVLTRPALSSQRIAEALGPDIPFVITPVTEIAGTGAKVDLAKYRGVILTSANAVPFLPPLAGVAAYCVGRRTALASGADVRLVARDSDDLVRRIDAEGPLLHAHGRETRGDVAKRLTSAGIETDSVVVYDQRDCALTAEGTALIQGEAPAVLPLWSPRSAARVRRQITGAGPNITVIALSTAVAEAWGGAVVVCAEPDGDTMFAQIVAAANR